MFWYSRFVRGSVMLASEVVPGGDNGDGEEFERRKKSVFGKDRRRKHHHWQATVFYADGEKFARVYIDEAKAKLFADRQKRSPIVKGTRVTKIA